MTRRKAHGYSLRVGQPFNPYGMFTGIWIPTALVLLPNLPSGAKICYGRLARYAGENGQCYVSVNTLAGEIGVGKRQTQKYLSELERQRFIRKVAQPGSTNRIEFLWHEVFIETDRGVNDNSPPAVHDTSPGGCTMVHPKRVNEENHHQESRLERSASSRHATLTSPAVAGWRASSKPIDDDEPTCALPKRLERTAPSSPEGELIAMAASKEQVLTKATLQQITRCLELRGVTVEHFAETMRPHFKNNIVNPSGFMLARAKGFQRLTVAAASSPDIASHPNLCAVCGEPEGRGIMLQETKFLPCPVCATPEFVQEFSAKQADREVRRGQKI